MAIQNLKLQTQRAQHKLINLPNGYTNKVQNVPAVSQVCICMKEKSIGNDLQETLYGEDDEEDVLQAFL